MTNNKLTIDCLRLIGTELMSAVPPLRFAESVDKPIEVGASGDTTYQIDRRAEDIVVSNLKRLSMPLTIISEEMGIQKVNGGGDIVLIDPIDGSRNAVSGIPLFCTSIAVSENDTLGGVYLSYILNLASGDEYLAERGKGAYMNGRKIRTAPEDSTSVILYETRRPGEYLPTILPLLSIAERVRCFGSIALDLAFLASGSASIFINPTYSRSFDFAGGALILKEAGGIITALDGSSIDETRLSLEKTDPLLASGNEQIHGKALRALGENS